VFVLFDQSPPDCKQSSISVPRRSSPTNRSRIEAAFGRVIMTRNIEPSLPPSERNRAHQGPGTVMPKWPGWGGGNSASSEAIVIKGNELTAFSLPEASLLLHSLFPSFLIVLRFILLFLPFPLTPSLPPVHNNSRPTSSPLGIHLSWRNSLFIDYRLQQRAFRNSFMCTSLPCVLICDVRYLRAFSRFMKRSSKDRIVRPAYIPSLYCCPRNPWQASRAGNGTGNRCVWTALL
jgi:hypothetical protein